MSSPLETFAGLLDRSIREIAALATDARSFDATRIGRIADIWDNNTLPLVGAACAPWPLRSRRASSGLRWMTDLGADRRRLMVDLDPSLDRVLPTARPQRSVHRDYQGRVFPGAFRLTAEVVDALAKDYDLANGSVRSLTARPSDEGLQIHLILATPRRFTPSTGRVSRDGSEMPWPAAPLRFTFNGVSDLQFDAEDRIGMAVIRTSAGSTVVIGRSGRLQANEASVWPYDSLWHESTAGQAADLTTPHERPQRRKPIPTPTLTASQRAAARSLVMLMSHARLVHHYPNLAAGVPILDICRVMADAGSAILAASARRGAARQTAFAELEQRWRHVPPKVPPEAIRSGPAMLRHVRYDEPHDDRDVPHHGSAVLLAAAPGTHPAAPWTLASEEITQPSQFRITNTAFDDGQHIHHDGRFLRIGDVLIVR
ncbi:hypothetical protein EV382_2818 [Micromonospora violae]|uniref:Uncharacterized protein n=1 Tax=Micromonospora violae TaxID=1278207 RepID=A0A4Q7UH76_9ACTN|nr:hypothetical protein [Micromonospora violae]RZT79601.1 hypothetical protein EV382_2818 [Micromonospora violae]